MSEPTRRAGAEKLGRIEFVVESRRNDARETWLVMRADPGAVARYAQMGLTVTPGARVVVEATSLRRSASSSAARSPQPARRIQPLFRSPYRRLTETCMRFNPHETTGSRVRIRTASTCATTSPPSPISLLNVHAAMTPRQQVVEEEFAISPGEPWSVETDETTGNRIAKFSSEASVVMVRYSGLVDITHRIVDPADVVAEAPSELPVSSLRFLYPSRYCPSDAISQKAWDLFGTHPRGYAQVRAVRDWVRDNIKFKIGTSNSGTTAVDTLRDGCGVAATSRTRSSRIAARSIIPRAFAPGSTTARTRRSVPLTSTRTPRY
jgi:hypothetical protein